ncbi:MAG: AgmX/PglI C-terminal domain-containing protein [Bdellovibrionia bacterium]
MSTQLILRQKSPNGQTRTWKLRPAQERLSFGASRLADLISVDPHTAGIEGVFAYQGNQWVYISMKETSAQSDLSPITLLKGEGKITVGAQEISFTTIEREEKLLRDLENNEYQTGQDDYRLLVAKKDGRIIGTLVLKPDETAPKGFYTEGVQVIEKNVRLEDLKDIAHQDMKFYLQNANKKETGVIAVLTVLFMMAALFGPQKEQQPLVEVMPKVATKIVLKKDIKPKKQEKKVAAQPTPTPSPTKSANNGSPTKTTVTNTIVGGRISQLLGKVSAQAAKSANVFVATGKKADEGASGRALAAVGNIDRAGTDWGAQGKSNATGVATAGQAGGRGIGSNLSQGKIGSAGVGLIEDESEVIGGLDPEIIAQYIRSQLGQILYCYERQLSAQPDLYGKVAVKFTIGPNGGVEARAINNSTLKNSTVEGCILSKIANWKFPAPQGGTKVLVTYPFMFKSTN